MIGDAARDTLYHVTARAAIKHPWRCCQEFKRASPWLRSEEDERPMLSFSFTAPTLLEPDAVPSANEIIHDEPREKSEQLAKIKKFVQWLKSEMKTAGLPVKEGLYLDSTGWVFEVAADKGFVMCFVSNLEGDEKRIDLLVTEMGGAAKGVDRAVEALLIRSNEIAGLEVVR
jgi:hypothetical protein